MSEPCPPCRYCGSDDELDTLISPDDKPEWVHWQCLVDRDLLAFVWPELAVDEALNEQPTFPVEVVQQAVTPDAKPGVIYINGEPFPLAEYPDEL